MAVTTLVDFWTQEQTAYQGLVAEAQAAVADAGKRRDAANAASAAAASDLAATQAAIGALKAKLAADATPADADADAKALRQLVGKLRNASGRAVQAGTDQDEAQGAVARAQAELALAGAKLAEATSRLGDAQARKSALDDWNTKLAGAPLKDVKANATAAQTGPEHTAAAARLAHDVPADLLKLTQRRRGLVTHRLDTLGSAVSDTQALLQKALGETVDGARLAQQAAFDALASHVRVAVADLDRAMTLLDAATQSPALTAQELADVTSGPSQAAGAPSVAVEDARDKAITALVDARAALEKATVAAQAPDPTADVTGKVATEQGAADAAQKDLDQVKGPAFTGGGPPSAKDKLDAWEAALPDSAYAANAQLQEAEEILARLAGTDPTALVAAVTAAETALVKALLAQASSDRTLAYLQDTLAQQAARRDRARAARQDTVFSFMRGDS